MAHARRPFADIVKLTKTVGKAHQMIAYVEKLYKIEALARDKQMSSAQRHALRQREAKPLLDKIYRWLEDSVARSPPKGKLEKAINYMLKRRTELMNYCLDGRIEIDNNLVENAIRPFAIGKKNWLFKGSPRGARAGCVLYSLIASAKANGWEPYAYLNEIFKRLPLCRHEADYQQLLPWNLNRQQN